ncbi:MAG TPA: hypothetical protein VJP85_02200 [Candidatus Baltobacteraceae bacterium]|nr:hypothetical protein [Candidatus Baltobacteraceae bacterium]
MRTVLAVTIALALCGPNTALAAGTSIPGSLSKAVANYQNLGVVRVIERFDDGNVATVDVMKGQYRIATSGGEDPALVMKLASQPIPDVNAAGSTYAVKSLGTKILDGVKVNGYTISSADGSYVVSVWVNPNNLPMIADVQTQGHKVNLQFGDFNNQFLIGVR